MVTQVKQIATEKDLKTYIESSKFFNLYKSIFKAPPYEEDFDDDEIYNSFKKIYRGDGDILILKDKGSTIGFIAGYTLPLGFYWIEELGISSKYRRKGLASLLISHLLEELRTRSINTVQLMTQANNTPALLLYKSFGFEITDEIYIPTRSKEKKPRVDTRIILTKNFEKNPQYTTVLHRVAILNPAQNITAIIYDKVDKANYPFYSNIILQTHQNVEQVGYLLDFEKTPRIEMAGMEFCGNAIRSLGYLLLSKDIVSSEISSSGYPGKLVVSKNKEAISATIERKHFSIKKYNSNSFLIKMPGICHLIIYGNNSHKTDRIMNSLIKRYKSPAYGVIYAQKQIQEDEITWTIDPYVYVRSANTLFNEKSCASGSLAIAYWLLSNNITQDKTIKVKQPSGSILYIKQSKDFFTIGGKVSLNNIGKVLRDNKNKNYIFVQNPII